MGVQGKNRFCMCWMQSATTRMIETSKNEPAAVQEHRQPGKGDGDGTVSWHSRSMSATAVSRKVAKTGTKSII